MEVNFDIDSSCSRLRIFDAFLVKYDASTGQKRLPLHNDQSEFSLTIAMNPLNEYEGGGTYFCETNETFKTEGVMLPWRPFACRDSDYERQEIHHSLFHLQRADIGNNKNQN